MRPRHAKSVARNSQFVRRVGGRRNFSNPYAPPVGTAQAPKSDLAQAGKPPKQPEGGVSVGVKWHASNDPNNPYEHVLPRSGEDGPGDSLQLGVEPDFS